MGFVLNPYDTCVANKNIEGKQCTIGYYVDDNVATHDSSTVLREVAGMVAREVGNITITTGNKHNFLGMDIVFHDNGTLTVDMSEYVVEALQAFPDKLRKAVASPARPDLFYFDYSSPRLSNHKSDLFHSLVMRLRWVSQRCRLDIATAIAFLSPRVSQPTEQDWLKLKRVLEFLNGTVTDKLTLGAESLDCLQNFVDVSFAVHADMRSHSGGVASFDRGVFMPLSRKQRLNTGSSTEGEIVGVSDYASNTIWLLKFLSAQGYKPKLTIIYQDNESAIKLLKHGKKPSSRRTRHIDIRLFNMKDKLREEGIEIVYCPTNKMVADFFTKPIQGSQFPLLRRIVLGADPISSLDLLIPVAPSLQERVGDHGTSGFTAGKPKSHHSMDKEGGRQQRRTYAAVVTGN